MIALIEQSPQLNNIAHSYISIYQSFTAFLLPAGYSIVKPNGKSPAYLPDAFALCVLGPIK